MMGILRSLLAVRFLINHELTVDRMSCGPPDSRLSYPNVHPKHVRRFNISLPLFIGINLSPQSLAPSPIIQ